MSTSDLIALASLAVALVALLISVYAIVRANATASAATLVTLNEGFRQAWERCLRSQAEDATCYELAELLNLLEIACAVYLDRSLSGNSRKLAFEYLDSALSLLIGNSSLNDRVPRLLQTDTTFIFIKRFLRKKRSSLSVTVPPEWYELRS